MSAPTFPCRRPLRAAALAGALLAAATTVAAAEPHWIVDTGPGRSDAGGQPVYFSESSYDYFNVSGLFELRQRTTLSRVQSWMTWRDSDRDPADGPPGIGRLQLRIRSDDGLSEDPIHGTPMSGLPGTLRFSQVYTKPGAWEPRWMDFEARVTLDPGRYWITVSDSLDFDNVHGWIPYGAPRPLPRYVRYGDDGFAVGWMFLDPPAEHAMGFRVAAVPEPATWALMAGGLALVAWRRARQRTG